MDANLITQIRNIKYNKGNFQTIKNKIGEERLKDFFTTLYPKFTITEIEAITEIPDSTLERWFQQLRIPFIRHRIRSKAFVGNENSEIIVAKNGITFRAVKVNITPQLAYLIGFTLGDGSVQQYMIEVFNKDRKLREILF